VREGGIGNEQALCGSVCISRRDLRYENLERNIISTPLGTQYLSVYYRVRVGSVLRTLPAAAAPL